MAKTRRKCKIFKSKYCVAVSNASAALHLSVNSLKIKIHSMETHQILLQRPQTQSYSGDIDLVDICEEDYNLSIDYFKKYLEKKLEIDKTSKIVIPSIFRIIY